MFATFKSVSFSLFEKLTWDEYACVYGLECALVNRGLVDLHSGLGFGLDFCTDLGVVICREAFFLGELFLVAAFFLGVSFFLGVAFFWGVAFLLGVAACFFFFFSLGVALSNLAFFLFGC